MNKKTTARMDTLALLLLFFLFSCGDNHLPRRENTSNKQDEHASILDSIIFLAKKHSLNAINVNWSILEKEMKESIKGDSLHGIIEPVMHLFSELKDFHGAIYIQGIRYNTYFKQSYHYPMNTEVLEKIQSIGSEVKDTMLPGQIAYLRIPHFYTFNQDQISEHTVAVRTAICNLQSKKPIGWIIDLRLNIGGNMYPMLSGLGELFPHMDLGGDTRDGRNFHSNWSIKNGNLNMWDSPMTHVKLVCNFKEKNINDDKKVAFLIGRYTSSSGEAVASAFKGQNHIRLVGEITSGWSSTTGWFPVNDQVVFSPTVAYFMSKDSAVHQDGIIPDDLIVEELNIDSLLTNFTLKKAAAWIMEK